MGHGCSKGGDAAPVHKDKEEEKKEKRSGFDNALLPGVRATRRRKDSRHAGRGLASSTKSARDPTEPTTPHMHSAVPAAAIPGVPQEAPVPRSPKASRVQAIADRLRARSIRRDAHLLKFMGARTLMRVREWVDISKKCDLEDPQLSVRVKAVRTPRTPSISPCSFARADSDPPEEDEDARKLSIDELSRMQEMEDAVAKASRLPSTFERVGDTPSVSRNEALFDGAGSSTQSNIASASTSLMAPPLWARKKSEKPGDAEGIECETVPQLDPPPEQV